MSGSDKRLARVLGKLLQHPQVLTVDGKGVYTGKTSGQAVIRLPAKLAGDAVSRGLLVADATGGLIVTDITKNWHCRVCRSDDVPDAFANRFAYQHWQLEEREIFDADGDMIIVQANVENSPLLSLFRQKDAAGQRFLSQSEFAAGEKFRQIYEQSTMGRMRAANWSSIRQSRSSMRGSFGGDGLHIRALDAKRQVMDALSAVGPVMDRLLFAFLVREQNLGRVERDLHWPKSSGRIILKIALARLANHYGL
ncbi:hypothetical protein MNBD_ALPHA06-256 [hydrothermal vent metagenome]|uniref:DUF6456 domain-containing protein n=1 Tax=hydrothermal vent metagenome TaxID=652676 RepID=A0A3B0R7E9_9ZZZZ